MPPLPAAASVIKVRLKGNKGGTPWNNIFHVRYAGAAPTVAQLTTWAGVINTAWATNLAPLAFTNVTMQFVDTVDLSSATSAEASTAFTSVGTRAGSTFPAQVAMVGSWTANLRFRGGHFRNYWPFGVTADQFSMTNWTAAFITAAQSGLAAFRTAINGSSVGTAPVTMIGLSYFTQHALRPTPLPVDITGVLVHNRIDTQRRRLGKELV